MMNIFLFHFKMYTLVSQFDFILLIYTCIFLYFYQYGLNLFAFKEPI